MGASSKPKEKDYRVPFEKAGAIFNPKTGRYENIKPAKKTAKKPAVCPPKAAPKVQKHARAVSIFGKLPRSLQEQAKKDRVIFTVSSSSKKAR
ncbi:hypothetical protein FQN49_006350 [Arthroderma sp. PD_2]|nr:hypothetical protein FQN49_006350 [Arthroderma sp. PD_2]